MKVERPSYPPDVQVKCRFPSPKWPKRAGAGLDYGAMQALRRDLDKVRHARIPDSRHRCLDRRAFGFLASGQIFHVMAPIARLSALGRTNDRNSMISSASKARRAPLRARVEAALCAIAGKARSDKIRQECFVSHGSYGGGRAGRSPF